MNRDAERIVCLARLLVVLHMVLVFFGCCEKAEQVNWTQDHIRNVPPILMKDPFLELLGQTDKPIPYTYEEAVKLAGHSCGAVAGAWVITRKALEALYPNEIPVRGQIVVEAPGAEDEWIVGVFGEIMTYVTGASPKTGFPGGPFGEGHRRRNLLHYKEEPSHTPPTQMVWVFRRSDTGAEVGVRYDLSMIEPKGTPERNRTAAKMARGTATSEETREWVEYWNARVRFIFDNAGTLAGFFTVTDSGVPSASK
jgi:hypothetical protein